MSTNEPHFGGGDGYRVVERAGCTFVHGAMPVEHFVALSSTGGPNAVVSPHLARLAGSTFAWGSRDAVNASIAALTEARTATPHGQPEMTGLHRWMEVGEHGSSALAIVHKLRGGFEVANERAHPHDPDDLRRCLLLLKAAPQLRGELHRMAEVSPQWASLVRSWAELEASFVAEAGPGWEDRASTWSAEQTYNLMQDVLSRSHELAQQGNLFGGGA